MKIFSTIQLAEAVELLKNGKVIIYPTETSYGIGCDATNAEAVKRVFLIKGRPEDKGVTVLLPTADGFGEKYVIWSAGLKMLAEKHWPGPLNIVLESSTESPIAPQCFTGSTISVRRSSHPIAQALADQLGVPIVSTSANISGEPELYDLESIVAAFSKQAFRPNAIMNAGPLPHNLPSTMVHEKDGRISILRRGAVTL